MSSRCLDALLLAAVLAWPGLATATTPALRVCSDPDNLPLSHADGSGFEDRIAALLARALDRPLQRHEQTLRRGFVRKTIGAGHCDVFIGVPAGLQRLSTTRPYYRSGYVVVTRADDAQPLSGFDDPRLPTLRIGVQLPGDDVAATPPGHALAQRGAVANVVGAAPYGALPAAQRLLQALQRRELDAALLWGPQAGHYVAAAAPALQWHFIAPPPELAAVLPFEFDIAVGVRHGDLALRDALQQALDTQRDAIDAILREHHVPRRDGTAVSP